MDVKELAAAISNFVNSSSINKIEQLAKEMAQDHPTLQQNKMRLACLFIEEMAAKPHTDARNESSRKVAKQMIAGHKAAAKQEIIDQDGGISSSLEKYIEEQSLPSKNLPFI